MADKPQYTKIFSIFEKQCFDPFVKDMVCNRDIDHFDGKWVASLVDHMCGLLSKIAVLADSNPSQEEIKDGDDLDEDSSEFKYCEKVK